MRSWMRKLCADPDSVWNERQGWMSGVRKVATRTGVWSVACNGYRLLALNDNGHESARQAGQDGDGHRIPQSIVDYIDRTPLEPRGYPLADLRSWLGPRVIEVCPSCKGYDGCHLCDGDGWVEPLRQPVRLWVGSGYFDPQLLSAALPKPLGGGWVTVGHSMRPIAAPPCLAVDGDRDGVRWRAIVMGLDLDKADRHRDALSAPTYEPGIGALWHLRAGPDRGILADWCAERGLDVDDLDPANRYAGLAMRTD